MQHPVEQYFHRIRVDAPHPSPDGRRLVYLSYVTGTPQWWIAATPEPGRLLEYPRPLTVDAERRPNPLSAQLEWFPDSKRLAYTHDVHGDEEFRIRLLDLESGHETELPHVDGAREYIGFASKDGEWLYFSSNRERRDVQSLMRWNVESGAIETLYTDERWSAGWEHRKTWRDCDLFSVGESNLVTRLLGLRRGTGKAVQLSPPGNSGIHPVAVLDDRRILVTSNHHRQFMSVGVLQPEIQKIEYLFPEQWDQRAWLSPRHDLLYVIENRAGFDVLAVYRWPSLRRVPLDVPTNGILGDPDFDDRGRVTALTFTSPVDTTEIVLVDPKRRTWQVVTDNHVSRVPKKTLVHPRLVKYRSQKKDIYALFFLPKGAKRNGRLPVIVWPHGGPQWQERAQQRPIFQYLLSRGIAVFAHNAHGSTGFGRDFAESIERAWGTADFPDLEAGVAWLKRSRWVDPERVGIVGGSYGGYMTLRAITKRPDLFKVAVDIFGPSNLFTFLAAVPDDWRPTIDREVGNPERDEAQLREASPFFALERIRCPLMVVQGARDPRVAQQESDQVVASLRARDVEVEYLVFEDEGHGFFKRENEMRFGRLVADFLEARL